MPRRSLWKGSFVDAFLAELKNKKDVLANKKIWSRRSSILPEFLNTTVRIYNGRNFVRCKVTEEKVGHKFGEFAITRKRRPFGAPKGKKWVIMPSEFTVGRLQNFSLAYLNGSYFMNNLVFGSCILFWTKLRCIQELCFEFNIFGFMNFHLVRCTRFKQFYCPVWLFNPGWIECFNDH